jgi:hypothetical protein
VVEGTATGADEADSETVRARTPTSDAPPQATGEWVVKQLDQADGYLSTIGTWSALGAARWFGTEQDAQAAAMMECPDGTVGAALHINIS